MRFALPISFAVVLTLGACSNSSPANTESASNAVAQASNDTVSLSARLGFQSPAARQVLADLVAVLTPTSVQSVSVYMTVGTPDVSALTESAVTAWAYTTSVPVTLGNAGSFTIGNLKRGSSYTLVALAHGQDPQQGNVGPYDISNADLTRSAAVLSVPANGTEQTLDPATASVLVAPGVNGGALTSLPVALKSEVFAGHANTGFNIGTGTISETTATPTINVTP